MSYPPNVAGTGVYCIRNVVNGKRYIGSAAKRFSDRWSQHVSELRRGRHHSRYLQAAWIKYGEDAFIFEVTERCHPDHCIDVEQVFIDFYKTADNQYGYNICPIAGSKRGVRLTPEQIEAMRQMNTGRKHTDETKAKIGLAHIGHRHTPQSIEKMAMAKRGKKRTPEAIEKTAASVRGVPKTIEHRRKISEANKGRPKDPLHMASMTAKAAQANLGRKLTEDHISSCIDGKRASILKKMSNGEYSPSDRGGMRLIEIDGEVKSMIEWSKASGINYGTLKDRLNMGWPAKMAVWAPKGSRLKNLKKQGD